MIDGVQVNQFGGDFDFASIPADGVDQVEIVRGPESALYGSNAVTGVINVVTHRGQGPPRFTFLVEGGSFTTRRFATGGSGLTLVGDDGCSADRGTDHDRWCIGGRRPGRQFFHAQQLDGGGLAGSCFVLIPHGAVP